FMTYSNIKMSEAWKNMYDDIAGVNARIEDAVSGSRVVQSFTNESFEMERFKENNEFFRQSKLGAYRVMAFVTSNIYMLIRFMTLVVLVYCACVCYIEKYFYG